MQKKKQRNLEEESKVTRKKAGKELFYLFFIKFTKILESKVTRKEKLKRFAKKLVINLGIFAAIFIPTSILTYLMCHAIAYFYLFGGIVSLNISFLSYIVGLAAITSYAVHKLFPNKKEVKCQS